MHDTPRSWFAPALVALLVGCGGAPEPEPEAEPESQAESEAPASRLERATDAYLAQDYDTYVALMEEIVEARPDSDRDRYNLACGYALAGRKDEAIDELSILLAKGVDFGVAADPDFESLHEHEEFQRIVAAYDRLYPPISTSMPVHEIPRYDLFANGVAHDPASHRFFVGSMRYGEVLSVGPSGDVQSFATVEADGVRFAALGMEVDPARGLLWVAGTHFKILEGYDPSHKGSAGVFAFDLATGEPRRTVLSDAPKGFNDLVVASTGDVYVSGGALYHLPAGGDSLSPVPLDPAFTSSNGLTFGDDEGTLFVAADGQGIARVDLGERAWSWVGAPDGVRIHGFDGLYFANGSLVGIQLGLGRWRAAQLPLDDARVAVTGVRVIEQSNPRLLGATTGVVEGDTFYFLAWSPVPEDAVDSLEPGFRGLGRQPVILSASLQPPAAFTSTTP